MKCREACKARRESHPVTALGSTESRSDCAVSYPDRRGRKSESNLKTRQDETVCAPGTVGNCPVRIEIASRQHNRVLGVIAMFRQLSTANESHHRASQS